MTPRFDCFFVLSLLYVVGSSLAIFDPHATTIKPPQRREPVLPWYLTESSDDLSRSPKWQTEPNSPRKPVVVNSGVKGWTPWRKNPESEIEQRTEISDDCPPEVNVDQDRDRTVEYEQFEQQRTKEFSTEPDFPGRLSQKDDHTRNQDWRKKVDKNTKDKGTPENAKKNKPPSDAENEFYEGIPADNMKPHKDKLIFSSKPKLTVARYHADSGVQCPEDDSTGQFVYPPDCKFFVNCWKGRAFVQPCAPGTMFNPNTLECDFPHKVKCYDGELADFQSNYNFDSSGRSEPLLSSYLANQREQPLRGKLQVPECPEHVTGLLPHPTDCTKFLQCANGGTSVMDCGPGTVFNSILTVCDWPRNVRGCEDALNPAEDPNQPLVPPTSYDLRNLDHQRFAYSTPPSIKRVACPPDYTGLLPHPDTCKKFLQCAHGITFIMDCGPGTAFNPLISVCDWPYNVPGCEEDKPVLTQAPPTIATTVRPWPSNNSPSRENWLHRYDHISSGYPIPGQWISGQNDRHVTTTATPPTDWNARRRPTWKPTLSSTYWTTAIPPYNRGSTGHADSFYNAPHGNDRHKDYGQVVPPTRDLDHSPSGQHYDQSGSWTPDYVTGQHPQHPHHSHHNHHHHHHYDPTGSVYNIGQGHGTGHPTPAHDHTYPHRPNEEKQESSSTWPSYLHHTPPDRQGASHYNPWNVPNGAVAGSADDSNTQKPQSSYDPTDIRKSNYNRTEFSRESFPANRRIGQEFPSSRPDHGRVAPEFSHPGNTRLERMNQTNWSQPESPGSQGFVLSTWSQEGRGELPSQSQTSQWNQGAVSQEDKLAWESSSNVYQQSTADREADSKLDQWASKTNIFQHAKGQVRPAGRKNTSENAMKSVYSNGIYVNINGTRGHFITKGIEVNQGHSRMKIYRQNELQKPSYLNKTYNTSNVRPQSIDAHRLHPEFIASTGAENDHAIASSATNLEPSYHQPPSHFLGSPSTTKLSEAERDYLTVPTGNLRPRYYRPSSHSLIFPDYTRTPTVDRQNPAQTSADIQPPYYEPFNHSQRPSNSTRTPRVDRHFPPIPSVELQPPYYKASNLSSSSPNSMWSPNFDSHYPPVPASKLQPPYYEQSNPSSKNSTTFSNIEYSSIPINFHPTYYQPVRHIFTPNSTRSLSVDSHYPELPATHLQPPYPQNTESASFPSNSTKEQNVNTINPFLLPPNPNYPVIPPNSPNSPSFENNYSTASTLGLKPSYHRSTESTTNPTPIIDFSGADCNRSFTTAGTTTEKIPDKHFILPNKKRNHETTTKRMTSSVEATTSNPKPSIEKKDDLSRIKFNDVVEPDLDYAVDVLDDKEVWKPVLVFENKTQTTTTEASVIMKINKKKTDVDLFNIEEAPDHEDEPPFPVYYVPPVQPLNHSKSSSPITPISGQVIRLRGGSSPYDGYVEVQGTNPGWGVVCDSRNSWTLKEAHVVCRQLGYARGAEMAWQGRSTRNGVPTWIAANSVACTGNETRFQSCKFTHDQRCRVERDAIGVRCVPNRVAHCRNDEIPYEGQCYHLADPDSGLNHAEALEYCAQRQSRLIDITSHPENDFVSEWLLQAHPEVGSIMTSGVGFTALNRTLWLWEDSSRAKFRFTKWWPGWLEDKNHPPWVGSRPVCIVMKRKFPCHERPDSICISDYFFWETEDCATSTKGHSYICKRPYDDIGCIYGKGNQYAGNANVTASGKPCLPWADEKVAHPLKVNVVNREIIEKLKLHNYCRNPNPNKESRPWCFTGAFGEREYCDIPPCGSIGSKKSLLTGQCKPKHFECLPGECIPSPWVCDGDEDCTNGADERTCTAHLNLFQKTARHKLEGYDVEKWLNTPLKTCALRCKEADFTCRSFAHKAAGNICLLSDSNVGLTGALKPTKEFDYYEMKERSLNCDGMYVCGNRKCINQTQVCNGKNDCNDRTDESICTVENLDYAVRLAGSNNSHEGRIEVKILGIWGQVCDDGFGMINADVICKELGFSLGALEIRPGGFYGNLDPPTRFMVDQLKCRGNETSLRECDFDGWGVHNCQPEEAVGVVCKTAVDSCQEGHWKCDNAPVCIPTPFICDEVVDCPDGSDESPEHCDAPFEIRLANGSSPVQGRVEVRHHGVWGTVCDDDFSIAAATVICRSLGYGGKAIAKKDGFFGPGEGPIWLDEVFCHGNESQLYRCEHNHWGQHNCDHNEDAGVICTPGDVNDPELFWETMPEVPEVSINDLLPADCGKRSKDFDYDEDLIFAKVVRGSVAPKGTYPWQASIRVRGHSRSSHWCGAVILSPLHVLTAAHCLKGYNKGTYFVRAGDYNTEIDEGTEVEANIQDYYIHEDFRKGHRMNNDIALVLLKGRGIPLGKDIMPICLPPENTEYAAGLNCTISGFGSIETGKSTHSKDLRYGWVPLLDQSVCRADYIYGEGAISDGMVCAGYLDEGVDTCDGDSGGPLACYRNGAFTLYGITSWGQHCGKANKPGVYVRVSYYRNWIDQKIKESLGAR